MVKDFRPKFSQKKNCTKFFKNINKKFFFNFFERKTSDSAKLLDEVAQKVRQTNLKTPPQSWLNRHFGKPCFPLFRSSHLILEKEFFFEILKKKYFYLDKGFLKAKSFIEKTCCWKILEAKFIDLNFQSEKFRTNL